MLPIDLPLTPMLARSADNLPAGMAYEPKWDGWRCLLARDGDRVRIWSRHGTELTAHFPELVDAGLRQLPEQCVLDGEIIIIVGNRLDYTRLAGRLSEVSRAAALARESPATLLTFDLLALDEHRLLDLPWEVRRDLLEQLAEHLQAPLLLSPVTRDERLARDWFDQFEGAGLDGVVAKPVTGRYAPGQRGWLKIKHRRTADVVVAGFRLDRTSTPERPQLGSLLLGLFDEQDGLHAVGVCAGFPGALRGELAAMFAGLEQQPGDPAYRGHPWSPQSAARIGVRVPDHVTRWSRPRDQAHLIWPPLVAEVGFDQLHDDIRFRSNTQFLRWRADKDPFECRFDQLEQPLRFDLADILADATPDTPDAGEGPGGTATAPQ